MDNRDKDVLNLQPLNLQLPSLTSPTPSTGPVFSQATPALPASTTVPCDALSFHSSTTIPLSDLAASASAATPSSSSSASSPSTLSTPLASRKARKPNVPTPSLTDDDDTSWKDVHRNIKHMDQLYDATFHSWLKSEDNVLVTSVYLHRIANEYPLPRVVNALKWLISDWRLESISVLVRHVTMDWNDEIGDLRRAHLLRHLTYNWATQYTATLISTVLASPPYLTSPAPPKECFLKAFTQDWDFSKLSEFFMYLQPKANVDYKLKCVMLQEAARRERETLGAKVGGRRRNDASATQQPQQPLEQKPPSVEVESAPTEEAQEMDSEEVVVDSTRLTVTDPVAAGDVKKGHTNRRHHRRTSSNDVTDIKRLRLSSPGDTEETTQGVQAVGIAVATGATAGSGQPTCASAPGGTQGAALPLPQRRATTPSPPSSLGLSSSTDIEPLPVRAGTAEPSSPPSNPVPTLTLPTGDHSTSSGPLSAPPTTTLNPTPQPRPQSTASFFHARHQHYHPYSPATAMYHPPIAHHHGHSHHHRRRSSSSSSASSSASAAYESGSEASAPVAGDQGPQGAIAKDVQHHNYAPAAAAINNQAFFANQQAEGGEDISSAGPAPSPTTSAAVMKRRLSVAGVVGVGAGDGGLRSERGGDVEMDG